MTSPITEPDLEPLPDPRADPIVGQLLGGRYRVQREVARGGLGVVYEALHVELERTVAVKVLMGPMARNPETIKRFEREARTASQIGHPNIVDVHDLGRAADGSPYLAMELLEGHDLDGELEEHEVLPPSRAIAVLRPVASALDVVHTRGIVHRDIKPANIFLSQRIDGSEQVKLLDFGLAAFQVQSERLTRDGSVVGTPHYMSPEAAEGALGGPRGDVYSLACVAYELLCGLLPFDADQPTGVLVKKVSRPAPTMRARTGRTYPISVERVLARSLERDPQRRHPSCLAFVDDLERAIADAGWADDDESLRPAPIAPTDPTPVDPLDAVGAGSVDVVLPSGDAAHPSGSGAVSSRPSQLTLPRRSPLPWLAGLAVVGGLGVALVLGLTWGAEEPAGPRATVEPTLTPERATEPGPLVETPSVDSELAPPPEPAEAPDEVAPDEVPPQPTLVERVEPEPTARRPRVTPNAPVVVPGPPSAPVARPSEASAAAETPVPEAPPVAPRQRAPELTREAAGALISGQLARAAVLYRSATQADANHAAAWRGLGVVEERLGHRPEAVHAYRQYLRRAPNARDAADVRERLSRLEGG